LFKGKNMFDSNKLSQWLSVSPSESQDKRYRYCLLTEKDDTSYPPEVIEELKRLVQCCHEDIRRHLRDLAGISLDPLGAVPANDPACGYPERLHIDTLKGYFGEIVAGIVAEDLSPFDGGNWIVPAFLFRFDVRAFHELERLWDTGKKPRFTGHFGEDCLAFRRDASGNITGVLVCEAKCTTTHRYEMIREAHRHLSENTLRPVSLLNIIAILQDTNTPDSLEWIGSLQRLYQDTHGPNYERCDLVAYVCGKSPSLQRKTWIQRDKPHSEYVAGRRLAAVEVHLHDVEDLIRAIYNKSN
jgi:hypothetical protein